MEKTRNRKRPMAEAPAQAQMGVERQSVPQDPTIGAQKQVTAQQAVQTVVDKERLQQLMQTLQKYKAGKARLEQRVVASENWWKLRNALEEDKELGKVSEGFRARSGWLHNVITTKHADAMEAYPEPIILPREQSDTQLARELTDVLPCVLEQNDFESTYSSVQWAKLKTGTGVYKVVWDENKLNGLGDIAISAVSILNLYWEPGVEDLQKSRYVFHVELEDNDLLEQMWPQLQGKLRNNAFQPTKFLYDDSVDTSSKSAVIDAYYRVVEGKKLVLHYIKFVGDTLLYATQNDPDYAQRGLYDHGEYPFVFDALFPIEGYPNCGYGYVDLCRSPQTEIDVLKNSLLRNARVCATPRFFCREDGSINKDEFLNLDNELVSAGSSLGDDAIRQMQTSPLPGVYVDLLNTTVQELRETSGNTETAAGTASSGVTAASAIAALQEASGKGSRDANKSSYRAFSKVVWLAIELDRQFYDVGRRFRITSQMGDMTFVSHDNSMLRPQYQGEAYGVDLGYRTPVFDIKVSAQRKNVYTRVSQNEMAIQFFQLGFFDPARVDQSLMCLGMMDFDGREELMQQVQKMGTMAQQLQLYQQLAITLAQQVRPDLAQKLAAQASGQSAAMPVNGGVDPRMQQGDAMTGGLEPKEHSVVSKAREQAQNAAQPSENRAVKEREDKR